MNIVDMKGRRVNTHRVEKSEQDLVKQYIKQDDIVLELGARYGSVSCMINRNLKNKKNQVVVEPDNRVWRALERNKRVNKCQFNIVKGFISNKKLGLTNLDVWIDGYGSTAVEDTGVKNPFVHPPRD